MQEASSDTLAIAHVIVAGVSEPQDRSDYSKGETAVDPRGELTAVDPKSELAAGHIEGAAATMGGSGHIVSAAVTGDGSARIEGAAVTKGVAAVCCCNPTYPAAGHSAALG